MRFNTKGCLALVALLSCLPCFANDGAAVRRTEDVNYGRKHGMALMLDVFQPTPGNGCGVAVPGQRGLWQSSKATPLMVTIRPQDYQPFLERGYTVFAVVTSSQPKFGGDSGNCGGRASGRAVCAVKCEDVRSASESDRHFGIKLRRAPRTFNRHAGSRRADRCTGPGRARKQCRASGDVLLSADRLLELRRSGDLRGGGGTVGSVAGGFRPACARPARAVCGWAARSRRSTSRLPRYRRY